MINLTYILSHIDKALAFEWIAESLDSHKFKLRFILLNKGESALEQHLKARGIEVERVTYQSKKDIPQAFLKVRKILSKWKTEIVHCHLFDACLVGLTAARSLGIKRRIFTRHHATIHHIYFKRAIYYDHFINRMATDIVAISENVKKILIEKENVKPQKVHLIHHGFKLEDFTSDNQLIINELTEKYQTQNKYPIIGVVARQTHWKGIQFIIPAFGQLLDLYPKAHLILANAQGDYKSEINKLLSSLKSGSYTEITFESNIFSLFKLFDIYIHTPIDEHSEAFGQTYVEALAAGTPSIFTLSGVAPEFIQNEKNALVVPFQASEAIYQAMLRILENPDLANKIKTQGLTDVKLQFDLPLMMQALEKLYT